MRGDVPKQNIEKCVMHRNIWGEIRQIVENRWKPSDLIKSYYYIIHCLKILWSGQHVLLPLK